MIMKHCGHITTKQDTRSHTPGTGPLRAAVPGVAGWFATLAVLAAILLVSASARAQTNPPAFGAEGIKSNVLAQLTVLRSQATIQGSNDLGWWNNAIAGMTTSLQPNRWVDPTHIVCGDLGGGVFDAESLTVTNLSALFFFGGSGIPGPSFDALVISLEQADRLLAEVAIQDATLAGTSPTVISDALANLASGDQAVTAHDPLSAISYYKSAWALTCGSTVPISGAYGAKSNVLAELIVLRGQATIQGSNDLGWWNNAIAGLTASLEANRWADPTHIVCGSLGIGVFDGESLTVSNLSALYFWGGSGISNSTLDGLVIQLEQADRMLAAVAIEDAVAAGRSPIIISNALANLVSGDQAASAGNPLGAIAYYKAAWAATCAAPTSPILVPGVYNTKTNVLAQLIALRTSANLQQPFAQKFADAILHLQNSVSPAYWADPDHLWAAGGDTVINEEKLSVNKLRQIMDSKKCPVDPAILQGFIDRLVAADRLLAMISIQNATAAGLNAQKIAQDLKEVAKGDAEVAAGRYVNGIEHYRNAWRHALELGLQMNASADGSTQVQFVANNSKSYLIQVSTDLANWAPLGTSKPDFAGNVRFTDPGAANQPVRFYRVIEQ
jgi:hypothetical protein